MDNLGLDGLKKHIPNIVTVTGMGCGFFSILSSQRGAISTALLLLLCAGLCDIFDGKLARILGTSSRFGGELDSLADAISFGVAPSILLYETSLYRLGWFGGACAFFFTAMAALRLARFNLPSAEHDRRDVFRGFSTPTAAIYVGTFVVMSDRLPSELGAFYAVALGGLMVSRVPSPAFKGAGVSSIYLVVGLLNSLALFLWPSFWTFAWWNLYTGFVFCLAYNISSKIQAPSEAASPG